MLHCQYVCNYYNKWQNLEMFLIGFDNQNITKDKQLQSKLNVSDQKFTYFCYGVKTVVQLFRKFLEDHDGNNNLEKFIKNNIKISKEDAGKKTQMRKYKQHNNTQPSDIGTSKNNKVQVSPIQASKKNSSEENTNTNADDIVNHLINNNDLSIQFSPNTTTTATTTTTTTPSRNRKAVEFLEYSPDHCGNHQRTHRKRLKTKQSQSVPVEDPFEGKGLHVKSDDDDLYNNNLWRDGFMVLDTEFAERGCIPIRTIQQYFGEEGNEGMLDQSRKKWGPCFNSENGYENAPVTRWMSGIEIQDGFFDNNDLKDKVSIC